MSNIVAGIGRGQLIHLEEHRKLKEEIYFRYKEGLKALPVTMNPYEDCSKPNFWLSCMLLSEEAMEKTNPEEIRLALEKENIEARPIWKPMHMQPVYKGYDFITAGDNVGEDIFRRGLFHPSDIKMTEVQQKKVINIIKGLF